MFEPRNAAKERAAALRTEQKQHEEALDRTRREIHAGRTKKAYTEEQLEVLAEFARLEQLRMLMASNVAHAYEEIAAGRKVFV